MFCGLFCGLKKWPEHFEVFAPVSSWRALTAEQSIIAITSRLLVIHRLGHPWRVYPGTRETLKIVLPRRLHLGGRRSNATELEPMRKQVESWHRSELTDVTAKVVIYEAFVEGKLEAPKHFAPTVHDLYFEPKYEEFRSQTIWSLSNAFTSAFKELDPIPQFKATAKLGEFLEARFSQSF